MKKPTTSDRYSDEIVAAMKKGRVLELANAGEPRIRFQVRVGRHILQCED